MVTAEVAVLLPALVALLVVGLRGVGVARTALACADGARAAARVAARDEGSARAVAAAREQCGSDAQVSVSFEGGDVRVWVASAVELVPGLRVDVSAGAVARREGAP